MPTEMPVEFQFDGLLAVLIGIGFLFISALVGLVKKFPHVLEKNLKVPGLPYEDDGSPIVNVQNNLTEQDLKRVVSEVLKQHCPIVHDSIIKETTGMFHNRLSDELSPLREELSGWRGSMDAKVKAAEDRLDASNGKDRDLQMDIRDLRKEIRDLTAALMRLRFGVSVSPSSGDGDKG